jgi:Fe-S-cluster containining protein
VTRQRGPSWKNHPARSVLLALYRETDALYAPVSCPGSTECCRFALTGREPYPHAVEMAEVTYAESVVGPSKRKRHLAVIPPSSGSGKSTRACAMLGDDNRCRIYASRPFGCRTFFCDRATGLDGIPKTKLRDKTLDLGRRIADLSARAFPNDPGPRAFTKALGRRIRHGRDVANTGDS